MLHLWQARPHYCQLLAGGKQEGDVPEGQSASLLSDSSTHTVVVATTKIQTAVITGNIGHSTIEVMLDSGSSISLLAQSSVAQMTNIVENPVPRTLLKTASGIPLPTVKYVTASVLIQNMETPVQHNFFVVHDLITPAILGVDFLQHHNLVLDFSEQTVQVYPKGKHIPVEQQQLKQIVDDAHNNKPHVGLITALSTDSGAMPEECAIPDFGAPNTYELPENCGGDFRQLVEEH